MKRLLPRPPRRGAKRPQDTDDAPTGAKVKTTGDQSTVPAGAEPADPSAPPKPTFRNRGRLRRRLRFLRRVRELGFRDLGGLVFDQHKFNRRNEELVRAKVAALAAVDAELRALEDALHERRDITELREPGITACPRCGTLHGSDARFCPSCGLALSGARTIAADVGEGAHVGRPQLQPGEPPASPRDRDREPQPTATHSADPEATEVRGRPRDEQPTAIARPGAGERREP
jgi:zinc-ribbon domain